MHNKKMLEVIEKIVAENPNVIVGGSAVLHKFGLLSKDREIKDLDFIFPETTCDNTIQKLAISITNHLSALHEGGLQASEVDANYSEYEAQSVGDTIVRRYFVNVNGINADIFLVSGKIDCWEIALDENGVRRMLVSSLRDIITAKYAYGFSNPKHFKDIYYVVNELANSGITSGEYRNLIQKVGHFYLIEVAEFQHCEIPEDLNVDAILRVEAIRNALLSTRTTHTPINTNKIVANIRMNRNPVGKETSALRVSEVSGWSGQADLDW